MARRKKKPKARRRTRTPQASPHRFGVFNIVPRRVCNWDLPANADDSVVWGFERDEGRRRR